MKLVFKMSAVSQVVDYLLSAGFDRNLYYHLQISNIARLNNIKTYLEAISNRTRDQERLLECVKVFLYLKS